MRRFASCCDVRLIVARLLASLVVCLRPQAKGESVSERLVKVEVQAMRSAASIGRIERQVRPPRKGWQMMEVALHWLHSTSIAKLLLFGTDAYPRGRAAEDYTERDGRRQEDYAVTPFFHWLRKNKES